MTNVYLWCPYTSIAHTSLQCNSTVTRYNVCIKKTNKYCFMTLLSYCLLIFMIQRRVTCCLSQEKNESSILTFLSSFLTGHTHCRREGL